MFGDKRRKTRRFLILCVLIIALFGIVYGKDRLLTYYGSGKESLSFLIEGEHEEVLLPFYSEQEDIYYMFLPSYANLSKISIYFDGLRKVVLESGENVWELRRGMGIQCLELDVLYDMTLVRPDDTEEKLRFKIMHSANIPALYIETQSGTMEDIDADKAYREEGKYTLVDADGKLLYAGGLKRINSRGNATWHYPKKSYGIKLKEKADLLGMGSAQSWILLSNVEDITYLRNKITYDMAVNAGMEGAPESRYIDLYLNHQYHGMYLLCEKIEIGENRIEIADLEAENEKNNKEIEQAETFNTDMMKGVILGKNPKDISGGYLLERDVPGKYNTEASGFCSELLGDRYTVKNPSCASVEEVAYIKALFDEMEKAVVSEDGVNPDTGRSFVDYIDVKSFAQKYIIEELCKNNGAGATSSWFYKPNDEISDKIFAGPVWDYDKAYGKLTGFNASARDLCYSTQRTEGTVLFWYLNRQPEFQEAVKACWADFFSQYISQVVEEKIVEYASEMYVSADMDVIRWKEIYGDVSPYGERSYPIQNFLTQRKEFLDEVWLQDAELCTVHFVAPEYARDTYMSVIKGECLEAVPELEDEEETGGASRNEWYTEEGEPFDITKPLYEDATVYAGEHETIKE